jgi:pyridoxamine 5'-phosphate oxidase
MINKIGIAELRREFDASPLQVDSLPQHPCSLFETWFLELIATDIEDPTAGTLATVDANGRPDTRVILLKDFSTAGFVFYTNYHSKKSIQMQACPWVALNFYWPNLLRQVRIRGSVQRIDAKESAAYFHRRPRDSQIATYTSRQSQVTTRAALEAAFVAATQRFFKNELIPYPDFWGGYRVCPIEVEFWHGRKHRLHDRVCYVLQDQGWMKQVLAP